MKHIDFPFHFDGRGHTAITSYEDHVCDMIEQFLFTSAGERVNRPDFGSGLLQMVFDPNSPELVSTVQSLVQSGLNRWLEDLIDVQAVEVASEDSTLRVHIRYILRRTNEVRVEFFEREGIL